MTPTKLFLSAAAAALVLSGAACASKPKPQPDTGPGPIAEGPGPAGPSGPIDQGATAPIPGSEQDFVINVGDRVYFDLDEYAIRGDARPVLDAQAQWLNRYPNVRIRLEGNADERGTREYNFALGGRRANAVRDYLVSRGVNPSRIETISYGKERPLDPGSNEEAWARNRNVHTAITGGAR
ncbi:MAG TPA: peptidoglycan-associated lipoprotein Pal [Caulobacteraceae bacterium]|nr:peptidoglycan-associated lipoprotein Pal [Caulobacteraceae bacterium]